MPRKTNKTKEKAKEEAALDTMPVPEIEYTVDAAKLLTKDKRHVIDEYHRELMAFLVEKAERGDKEVASLKGVITKQQRDIASLSVQLAPLALLQQMEKIGRFTHISKQEVWGFAEFERKLAQYPARVHADLRDVYHRMSERTYWYGFHNAKERMRQKEAA